MKKTTWHFENYEIKTDYYLFKSFVRVGTHFFGVKCWSIEFWFDGGCIGFSKFIKRWEMGNDFSDRVKKKGKLKHICIRFGSPIVDIYLTKKDRDWAMEHVKRYEISY